MLDIIAFLSRQQINTIDARDDDIVDVLAVLAESVTVTESAPVFSRGDTVVKWGAPTTGKWSLFTWA